LFSPLKTFQSFPGLFLLSFSTVFSLRSLAEIVLIDRACFIVNDSENVSQNATTSLGVISPSFSLFFYKIGHFRLRIITHFFF